MQALDIEQHLIDALAELERDVVEPVLPGESAAWCRTVYESSRAVDAVLGPIADLRAAALDEIARADTALIPRVDAMRAAAADLREAWRDVVRRLAQGAGDEQETSGRSPRALEAVDELRETLLEWIVHSRAIEAEIRTYSLEVSMRDRGVVD